MAGMTCVVIDDDVQVRKILEGQLNRILGEGWEILVPTSRGGAERLLARLPRVNLILLDGRLSEWGRGLTWEQLVPSLRPVVGDALHTTLVCISGDEGETCLEMKRVFNDLDVRSLPKPIRMSALKQLLVEIGYAGEG